MSPPAPLSLSLSLSLMGTLWLRAAERRHPAGRERMVTPTLQTLQAPNLLLPWACFRDGGFPNPGWRGSTHLRVGLVELRAGPAQVLLHVLPLLAGGPAHQRHQPRSLRFRRSARLGLACRPLPRWPRTCQVSSSLEAFWTSARPASRKPVFSCLGLDGCDTAAVRVTCLVALAYANGAIDDRVIRET